MDRSTDLEFEDKRITKVQKGQNGWGITFEDGFSFSVPNDSPVEPKEGMIARLYGKGLGFTVRGLDLGGIPIYYRTQEEEQARHDEWAKNFERERQEAFEKTKVKMDAQFDALPEPFQRRIERFRSNNPNFRWEYEPYELFCCEEAVKIAKTCGIPQVIETFRKAPLDIQRQMVPDVDYGEHSGNTFGCACRLAYLYLTDEEGVVNSYGALAPLVGSEAYGG